MPVTFIKGRAGCGKSTTLYQKINEILKSTPVDRPTRVWVVVPKQSSFETEKALSQALGMGGLWRVEVLSPSRLCQRILQAAGQNLPLTDELKQRIYLHLATSQEIDQKNLSAYAGQARSPSFANLCAQTILEMKSFGMTPEKLQQVTKEIRPGLLARRLIDIAQIWQQKQTMFPDAQDSQDALKLATDLAHQGVFIADSHVFWDGMDGDSPLQLDLFEALAKNCASLTVSLTLPPDGAKDEKAFGHERALFGQLCQRCTQQQIPYKCVEIPCKIKENQALSHLEQNLFATQYTRFEEDIPGLSLRLAANPQQEVEAIAADMLMLCKNRGLTFSDMALCCGDMDSYAPLIARVFEAWGIPYFLDQNRSATQSPPCKAVGSLLQAIGQNLPVAGIFAALKCGILPIVETASSCKIDIKNAPAWAATLLQNADLDAQWCQSMLDDLHLLENYCLHMGIRGISAWLSPFTRGNLLYDLNQINAIREVIAPALSLIHEAPETARGIGHAVKEWLLKGNMQKQAEALSAWLNVHPDALPAAQGEIIKNGMAQSMDAMMEILTQMVDLLGDNPMSIDEFANLLQTGLASVRIGVLPPTLQQVSVYDPWRGGAPKVSALFWLGCTQEALNIPARQGLLSDHDISQLGKKIVLGKTALQRSQRADRALYHVITRAKDMLYISYPAVTLDGKTAHPSWIYQKMKRIFPKLHESGSAQGQAITMASSAAQARQMLPILLSQGLIEEAQPLAAFFMEKDPAFIKRLQGAFAGQGQPKLSQEQAENLLQKNTVSASQLQSYAQCPYQYFLQYGLSPLERKVAKAKASDVGSIMHEAMENFSNIIDWKNAKTQDIDDAVDKALEKLDAQPSKRLPKLPENGEGKFCRKRLEKALRMTAHAAVAQMQCGDFSPFGYEIGIGMQGKYNDIFDALRLIDDANKPISLVGKIDRVDVCTKDNVDYLRIIDYKTNDKKLKEKEVEKGMDLQIPLYMAALLEAWPNRFGRDALPASLLHLHMQAPLGDIDDDPFKLMSLKGWQSTQDIPAEISDHLAKGQRSIHLPLNRKVDGEYSNPLSQDELIRRLEVAKEKAKEIVRDVQSGDISRVPDSDLCKKCPYKTPCGRDSRLTLTPQEDEA